jgi:hypothetical protein
LFLHFLNLLRIIQMVGRGSCKKITGGLLKFSQRRCYTNNILFFSTDSISSSLKGLEI